MKIHYLQHVPFEDVAYMGNWAKENGICFSPIRLYENDPYPPLSDFEALIIMGGPMGAGDDQIYPWLKSEKAYIWKAIQKNKIVVGVCLGAQLIAVVLGAKVYPNPHTYFGDAAASRRTPKSTSLYITGTPSSFNRDAVSRKPHRHTPR